MHVFETNEPISVLLDVAGGHLSVHAGNAGQTTVDLGPHNPERAADVELAERTTVDLTAGRLVVRSPRTTRSRLRSLFGGFERIDLAITVPAGSTLEVHGWGEVGTEGRLERVDLDTAMGDIALREVGRVRAKTSMGDIRVDSSAGPAQLRTSAGSIQVGWVGGDLTARTSAGDVRVEDGVGELRLSTGTGDVRVERAGSAVTAKTSAGDIRLHSVNRGVVTAESAYGQVEIGVARGTAAWLEVEAAHGVVRSHLEQAEPPGDGEQTVEIRATTGYGDIILRRA